MESIVTTWETLEADGWRKASYSTSNGGNCVMTKAADGRMAVGDTKNPDGTVLAFGAGAWEQFLTAMR